MCEARYLRICLIQLKMNFDSGQSLHPYYQHLDLRASHPAYYLTPVRHFRIDPFRASVLTDVRIGRGTAVHVVRCRQQEKGISAFPDTHFIALLLHEHDHSYSQITKLRGDLHSSRVSARGSRNISSQQCSYRPGKAETALVPAVDTVSTDRLHVLMPASNGNINLCKTLMTAHILGYPKPTLIAWNEKYDEGTDYENGRGGP
nr:hypothetical protein CFP56_01372 [Quercus suber]